MTASSGSGVLSSTSTAAAKCRQLQAVRPSSPAFVNATFKQDADEVSAGHRDVVELATAVDRHEHLGSGQPEVHERNQALAAGDKSHPPIGPTVGQQVQDHAHDRGLYLRTIAPDRISFMPPLIIEADEIEEVTRHLAGALDDTLKALRT